MPPNMASALERYSPSRFLDQANALVEQGMKFGVESALTMATGAGAGFVAGFGMATWGDKAHVMGAPIDLVTGTALWALGTMGAGGEDVAPYVLAAGNGIMAATMGRIGQEAAYNVQRRKAEAAAAAPKQ